MHALILLILFDFMQDQDLFTAQLYETQNIKKLDQWKYKRMQKDLLKKLSWLVDTGLWLTCMNTMVFLTSNCGQAMGMLTPCVLDHQRKSFSWSALFMVW